MEGINRYLSHSFPLDAEANFEILSQLVPHAQCNHLSLFWDWDENLPRCKWWDSGCLYTQTDIWREPALVSPVCAFLALFSGCFRNKALLKTPMGQSISVFQFPGERPTGLITTSIIDKPRPQFCSFSRTSLTSQRASGQACHPTLAMRCTHWTKQATGTTGAGRMWPLFSPCLRFWFIDVVRFAKPCEDVMGKRQSTAEAHSKLKLSNATKCSWHNQPKIVLASFSVEIKVIRWLSEQIRWHFYWLFRWGKMIGSHESWPMTVTSVFPDDTSLLGEGHWGFKAKRSSTGGSTSIQSFLHFAPPKWQSKLVKPEAINLRVGVDRLRSFGAQLSEPFLRSILARSPASCFAGIVPLQRIHFSCS